MCFSNTFTNYCVQSIPPFNPLSLPDDRSAIQKKTFTKWINTYLMKVGQSVDDLYADLGDGNRLITLLEILTGQRLVNCNSLF